MVGKKTKESHPEMIKKSHSIAEKIMHVASMKPHVQAQFI